MARTDLNAGTVFGLNGSTQRKISFGLRGHWLGSDRYRPKQNSGKKQNKRDRGKESAQRLNGSFLLFGQAFFYSGCTRTASVKHGKSWTMEP
ncbi:hypothetical protein [Gorillibacterium sp. sgz5001074]|uniref:hypothetical protein n=1 Tax=Gorillibacterium sp. sgz5001074 TaxID=3446695 RepID=UPI003F664DC9